MKLERVYSIARRQSAQIDPELAAGRLPFILELLGFRRIAGAPLWYSRVRGVTARFTVEPGLNEIAIYYETTRASERGRTDVIKAAEELSTEVFDMLLQRRASFTGRRILRHSGAFFLPRHAIWAGIFCNAVSTCLGGAIYPAWGGLVISAAGLMLVALKRPSNKGIGVLGGGALLWAVAIILIKQS